MLLLLLLDKHVVAWYFYIFETKILSHLFIFAPWAVAAADADAASVFEHLCAFNLYLILFNIHTSICTIYFAAVYCMDIYVCFFHFLAVAQFGLAPGRGNSNSNNNNNGNRSNKSPRSTSALAQCRQLPYRQLPLINGSQRNQSNQHTKNQNANPPQKKNKCVMRDENKI